jgi:hypothetical protein
VWGKIKDNIGSDAGQSILSGVGDALSDYAQGKRFDEQQARLGATSEAEIRQRQLENAQNDARTRQISSAQLLPMGAEQGYAQKQALAKALLGGARNVSFTPGDPGIAAAMGSYSGGMKLPEGGLDPAMLERLYGDNATQAAIAAFQKNVGQVNPRVATQDLGTLFGNSADGSENAFTTDVRTSNQGELNRQMDESAKERAAVIAALTNGQQPKGDGGSKWGTVAKIGMSILPFFL